MLKRPLGIAIVPLLMILFGIIEIATGFSHNFVGISTSTSPAFTVVGALIGAFYSIAGILTLMMKRWAVLFAIALLIGDVVGRLALVATGLFPLNSSENITGIVGGTGVAVIFVAYLWSKLRIFPHSSSHRPALGESDHQLKS